MNNFWKKIKILASALLLLSIIMAVSVSSCNSKKSGSESTEQKVEEKSEHPSGGQEHPADSVGTSSESDEHPTDSEHPSGSEHPSN